MDYKNTYVKYYKKHIYNKLNHHLYSFNKKKYNFFIVIPIYNEYDYILDTLNSIQYQDKDFLKNTLSIFVINNSQNAAAAIVNNNKKTHKLIVKQSYKFEYAILDYYSSKNAFPHNSSGVGYARKVGMDFALQYSKQESLLCCVDADTILNQQYLSTVNSFFKDKKKLACTVNFIHQKSTDKKIERGIRIYENELKRMAAKLYEAASPYSYVSMGSTIVCRINAYIAVSGMPKKSATEDFYFLQALAKFTTIHFIEDILVYPSSRCEQRVYLGTGARMKEYKKHDKFNNIIYSDDAYETLKLFLSIIKNFSMKEYNIIHKRILKLNNNKLNKFLLNNNFKQIWVTIQSTAKTRKQFELFFNQWFDALKTLKFLKQLSQKI
mgnify:CR=1 FL=1